MAAVNALASNRIDALRSEHGNKIGQLSAAKQTRYRAILRQVPAPSVMPLKLPDVAVFRRGQDSLPSHVYAQGTDAPIYLNGWEVASIGPEAGKETTSGWLRNGEREGWFCVAWRDGTIWRGFFPDLLVAREDGNRLVVDIIDPHDHTRPDALGKAQGLSAYAAKHIDELGHIDLVAKVKGKLRRLHLEKASVRDELDALTTTNELANLYVRSG